MTTKKQKRLAGEQRRAERDAAHEAECKRRADAARHRAERRMKREAEQERHKQALEALNKGLRPRLEPSDG